jgi:hypothetical protein
MKYFENLPTIEYSASNLDIVTTMKNVFYNLKLDLDEEGKYIEIYRISGTKRLDEISQEIYGKVDHWWIIAQINDINDIIFDIPLNEELLHKIARDRTEDVYGSDVILSENLDAMNYYVGEVEELVAENDAKRVIKVISPRYIGAVLTEVIKSL